MKELKTISEVRSHLEPLRRAGRSVGLVPTMGALHAGHRSLIRAGRADCDELVVSIFVNPTQFGPGEDYQTYPGDEAADLAVCRAEGVDSVFLPAAEEIYPPGDSTRVTVGRVTEVLCGPLRPGHFDGVATVVAKLFNIVQPHRAYFGQKDAQQAVVIRRMTRDLCWPTEIVVCPTVREPDGLALSSRNAYLTSEQRQQGCVLYRALCRARNRIEAGPCDTADLTAEMRGMIEAAGPCTIEYIEVVDADTLEPRPVAAGRFLVALAVRIGPARLIDNIIVEAGRVDAAPPSD